MTNRRRVSDNNKISQLLRDSFSVSQQPPIWEHPSHYSMRQSQRAVSRCVEAAAPAVSAAQDRGEDRLRSETSARRHGGWVAALLSYTPHTYPHPRSLLVSWYWGHVQHDPCEGRPSVCSGARKAVVLLMVKRRSEGSCARVRHTSTHLYIYLQHSMLRLKLDIL